MLVVTTVGWSYWLRRVSKATVKHPMFFLLLFYGRCDYCWHSGLVFKMYVCVFACVGVSCVQS